MITDFHAKYLAHELVKRSASDSVEKLAAVLSDAQVDHVFIPGTTIEQVKAAYEFDRILRDLVTEALEVVEVDARTAIAYHFGQHYGAFGHTSPANFFGEFRHRDWLDKLNIEATRSNEQFVQHYRNTYQGFPDLPVWMVTEVMSFGALSIMFKGMLRQDQRAVSQRYGVQPTFLASWFHHLVYVRNVCAHHSRLWDRVWAIKPDVPPLPAWRAPLLPGNDHLRLAVPIEDIRHNGPRDPKTASKIVSAWWQWLIAVRRSAPKNPLGILYRTNFQL